MSDLNQRLNNLIDVLETQTNKSILLKDSLEELRMIQHIYKLNPDKMNESMMQDMIKDAMSDAIEIGGLGILLANINE